jgi:hypothetical protein
MNNSFAFKYGFILFALLTSFFTLMWAFGQADQTWLRIFNGVIHFGLLYFAILNYRKTFPETYGNYLSGVGTGMIISAIGSILFAFVIALFANLDGGFAAAIEKDIPYNANLIPFSAALFVFVEGIAAGLIGSYFMTRVVNAQMLKSSTGQANFNINYNSNAHISPTSVK